MSSMNTRLNINMVDRNIIQKHRGSKQVGLKQLSPGVETGVHEVSNDNTAVAQRRLEDKKPEEKTNTDCLRSTQQCMKSRVAKHLGVAEIHQHNGLVDETNMTLFAKVRCFLIQTGLSKILGQRIQPVAAVEKIYAHESLTFNNIVACEVISKWRAGLKDDMDARSDICKVEIWVTKGLLVKAKGNVFGLEIIRDQSGNTLRVLQSRIHNEKLVQTLLKGDSTLSLEDSLSRDCDVKKNASAAVDMLDGFDRGLQTNVQVFVDFDYAMRRSITVMSKPITGNGVMILGCAGSLKANMQHMEALSTTEPRYMTFTEA
nr:hypothetical protein [Tanacetum cinerariifolium]